LAKFLFLTVRPVLTYLIRQFWYVDPLQLREICAGNPDMWNPNHFSSKFAKEDFLLLRNLGGGGRSVVHLSFHKPTGVVVVVKQFHGAQGKSKRREVDAMQNLRHEAIVQCYGQTAKVRDLTVIYRFMPLGSTESQLKDPEFDDTRKTKVVLAILSGLDYIHSKGYMHRDLKLGNVLLDADWRPVIADFDMSRPRNATMTKEAGTVDLIAPEALGNAYSYQADLYSLGATIYRLATLDHAIENWSQLDPANQFRAIREGRVKHLSHEYGGIANLCNICTSKDPTRRSGAFYLLSEFVRNRWYFSRTDVAEIERLRIVFGKPQTEGSKPGTARDDVRLLEHLSWAAGDDPSAGSEGVLNAQFYMATMYLTGFMVAQDEQKGLDLPRRAAGRKHPSVLYRLGVEKLHDGLEDEALALFKEASDLENGDARYKYGYMTNDVRLIQEAAEKFQSARACRRLSSFYEEIKSYENEKKYAKLAADQILPSGLKQLGIIELRREETKRLGYQHLQRAAELGDPQARDYLVEHSVVEDPKADALAAAVERGGIEAARQVFVLARRSGNGQQIVKYGTKLLANGVYDVEGMNVEWTVFVTLQEERIKSQTIDDLETLAELRMPLAAWLLAGHLTEKRPRQKYRRMAEDGGLETGREGETAEECAEGKRIHYGAMCFYCPHCSATVCARCVEPHKDHLPHTFGLVAKLECGQVVRTLP
jgi:serine/threonine protein kinase